ncbi:MAG: DMT family transporter [Deltaproteobacteria bacterium]|nr:DMT family transporter [Deltaproteobacteria bacterium]
MFFAWLTTLSFACSGMAGGRASFHLGPTRALLFRSLLASLIMTIVFCFLRWSFFDSLFWPFFLSGLLGFGVADVFMYVCYRLLSARLGMTLVQCLAAPFAILIEVRFLGVSLSAFEYLSIVLILTGVFFAVRPKTMPHLPVRQVVVGFILAVFGAFVQGASSVLSRYAYQQGALLGLELPGFQTAYYRVLGGTCFIIFYFLVVKAFETRLPEVLATRQRSATQIKNGIPALLFLVLFGPCMGVTFNQLAFSSTDASLVLPVIATVPVFMIPLAKRFEGEKVSLSSTAGTILAVMGVALLSYLQAR